VNLVLLSNLPSHLKLAAVVMAHHARDDGSRVFPSVRRVAAMAGVQPRRARALLSELRTLGILKPAGLSRTGTVRYVFDGSVLPPGEDPHAPPTSTEGGYYSQRKRSFQQDAQVFHNHKTPDSRGGLSPATSDRSVIDQETLLGDPRGETTEEPDADRRRRLELLEGIRGRLLRLELEPPARTRKRAR